MEIAIPVKDHSLSESVAIKAAISRRRAWLLVGFMWVAYFLNYSDRLVVFSIFPILRSELNFSDIQLGLTSSIFIWVYGACSPIAGQMGDRFSKRRLIILSIVLWSFVTMLTGFSTTVLMLLSCRALIGITESLFMPAATALTASSHPAETRSRAISVFDTAQLAGTVMGGWYGGFMAQEVHWRFAFISLGLFGLVYAIPYRSFLRTIPEEPVIVAKGESKLAGRVLATVPTYLFLCLTFPAFTLLLWIFYTWLPIFLYEKFSLSLRDAGFTATAYVQTATFIGLIAGGVLADRLYLRTKASRFLVLAAGMLIAAPSAHFVGSSETLLATKIAAVSFGLGSGLFIGNLFVSAFEVVPANTRASAVGFINLIGAIVSGIGVLAVGVLKKSVGIDWILSYAALACFLAGILLICSVKVYFKRDYERVH